MDKAFIQVLLVEDQQPDIILLQRALRNDPWAYFQVEVASSLRQALSLMREKSFQVVLLDLGLPDSQGLETFKRCFGLAVDIPFIILSGLDDEQVAIQSVQAGAQDYLVKGEAGWSSVGRAIRYAIERQQIQAQLRSSERRFRAMIEHNVDCIMLANLQGEILYESPAALRLLGYEVDVPPSHNTFHYLHPDDVGAARQMLEQIMQRPLASAAGQMRAKHKDGTWRWVSATITNWLDHPDVAAIVINYLDITDSKRAEQDLLQSEVLRRRSEALLHSRLRLAELAMHSSVEELIRVTLDEVEQYTGSLFSLFQEVIADAHTPFLQVYSTKSTHAVSTMMGVDQALRICNSDIFQECLHSHAPILLNNFTHTDLRLTIPLDHIPLHRVMVVPVLQDGLARAVIGVVNKPDDYTHEDVEVVQELASFISDLVVRKQAEEALRQREQYLQTVFDTALNGLWLVDDEGRFLEVNQAYCAMVGYSPKEMLKMRIADVEAVCSEQEIAMIMQRVAEQGQMRFESRHFRRDGSVFDVEVCVKYLQLHGGQFVCFIDDISHRKQAEKERQTLLEIMAGLAVTEDLVAFLRLVHLSVAQVIYADNFFVVLYDEDTGLFEEVYVVDQYDEIFPPSKMEHSISAYVFRTARPLRLTPSLFDALVASGEVELVGTHPGSWLGVPLRTSRGVIGVMVVQDYASPDRYSEHDLDFFASIANQVALAVEHRKAEAEMGVLKRRMELILNSAGVGIYGSDVHSRIIFTNHEMARMVGHERENLLGQNMHALCHSIRPDGRPYPEEECPLYRPLIDHNTSHGDDEIFYRADGSAFPVEYTSTPIREGSQVLGTVVVVRDITERVQSQAALHNRSQELSTLLQAGRELNSTLDLKEIYGILKKYISAQVPCDIIVISSFDAETQLITCQYVNGLEGEADVSGFPPILLEPEGYGTQSRVIRSGKSLLLPDIEASLKTTKSKMYFDEVGNIEECIPEEAERTHSAMLVPLILDQHVAGVLQILSFQLGAHTPEHLQFVESLVFRVTTAMSNALLFQRVQAELLERRHAEEEVRKLNAELEKRVAERTTDLRRANAELEQTARAKDEFLANMSHELRTPLNAILTLSESLEEGVYGPLGARQIRPVNIIAESGHHLLNLINDILDLSKIEAGKLALQIAPLEVESLCQACIRMILQQANKKEIQVSLEVDPEIGYLSADARSLKQMLVNLLSNAVKFTPASGKIGLIVKGDAAKNAARFTVWDTGIGIEPEQTRRLFRPFVQIDGGLARQYEGTGLGLALVYRMAEMHNGSISLESTPGQGSRFTLSLPWAGADEDGNHSLDVGQTPTINRVLLVAPLAEATHMLERYFEDLGALVRVCSTLEAALARIVEMPPDVILLDSQLPDDSGLQVLAGLQADARAGKIPTILVSKSVEPPDSRWHGIVEYLIKPVSRLGLHIALRKVLTPQGAPNRFEETRPSAQKACVILLAEDNLTSQATFADYLSSKGYQTILAGNGIEALSRAREQRPDLVLMDIQMPGMDGLEATRRMKADPEMNAIPIVALTALAMPGDRERCLQAGASAYLTKPVSLKLLLETIESFVGS